MSRQVLGAKTAGQLTVPAGHMLYSIVIEEKAGREVLGGISFGTTEGATDVVSKVPVGPNDRATATGELLVALHEPVVVYYTAKEHFNGAELDIYFGTLALGENNG